MKIFTKTLFLVFLIASSLSAFGQSRILNYVSTYDAGAFDEGAAEIVAYYGNRIFLTNAENDALDIIDITDPRTPVLVRSIDISTYGEGLNSVATYNGTIAIAVEGMDQMPGKIVVLDTAGTLIQEYAAGVLPDMVTFTPDGNYILAACEGEPSDDYLTDPEGSVTVVDITAGPSAGVVSQITFTAWNSQKYSLLNAGVRIFGVDATTPDGLANVANDLEPEYIAVDPNNDSIAYVVCQENNAMIVIDYKNAAAVDIMPFGFKDHTLGTPALQQFFINQLPNLPQLGTPVYNGGQPTVNLGGFSGMWYEGTQSTATSLVFYAIPDRGPNAATTNRNNLVNPTAKNLRPFKLPEYQSRVVKFTVDLTANTVSLDSADQIYLTHPDGTTPLRGFGNIPTVDEVPVTYTDANTAYGDSSFFDGTTYYHQLPYDPYGGDFESIMIDGAGNFWMVDEYRPAIYKFNSSGVMLDRFIPKALGEGVFFSEFAEGSSNNKYFEIYNPTEDTIDMDKYMLVNCTNGCDGGHGFGIPGQFEFDNTPLIAGRKLAPGEVFVVAHPSAQADILTEADTTFTFLSNGDDWWAILNASDSSIVDQVGDDSMTDPGGGWDVAGVFEGTKDHTLIRRRFVTKGNSNWAVGAAVDSVNSEWIVEIRPTADTVLATLGSHVADYSEYGSETLPAVYNNRRANRGFEASALDTTNGILYAFIQSPMDNPNTSNRTNDVLRILGVDPATGMPVSEYVYLLEQNSRARFGVSRVDKIGDAVFVGDDKMWVIERDSSTPDQPTGKKYVFEINLKGATNILGTALSNASSGATLESMSADDLAAAGIKPVSKRKVVNLPSLGYLPSDKAEGLSWIPGLGMAVLNDNDFGLAGAGVSDNSILGLITFGDNYALDASNRDDSIRFENWPVLGMYQPDATKAFDFAGETYIFTANEGDARDYDGFSEEERAGDLNLDSSVFPDFANLQQDENLGRINTTTTKGDIDGDGDYDEIYVYGARSFSVWDKYGNQVWDSGNEFARVVADSFPAYFNSTNDDNDSFDNRSDDKGTEPEAIEIANYGGKTWAFIGLERMGGIMVYDVTDPKAPVFVEYELNRNFNFDADTTIAGDLAPEDIKFIAGEDSPLPDTALLVVANEVSGTLSIYSIVDKVLITSVEEEVVASTPLVVYPNPVNGGQLNFNLAGNYTIFNMVGQQVARVENAKNINVSAFKPGVYVIRSDKNQVTRFIKK